MNIDIKSIFDITKLPSKFFFLFAIISASILFLDNAILKRFKVEKIADDYGWILGLIFLFSTGLVIINIAIWFYEKIRYEFLYRKVASEWKIKIKSLDSYEKSIVREFLICRVNSLQLPIDDSVVSSMLAKDILYINQSFSSGILLSGRMVTSVSLSDFVRKNINIVDLGYSNNLTEEEKKFIDDNRPTWLQR